MTPAFAVKGVVSMVREHGLEARVTSPVPLRHHRSLWPSNRTVTDGSSTTRKPRITAWNHIRPAHTRLPVASDACKLARARYS